MKYLLCAAMIVGSVLPAFAAETITLGKREVRNVLSLALKDKGSADEFSDCKKSSDCGTGEICVGIGICVPDAKVKANLPKLPTLLGPME